MYYLRHQIKQAYRQERIGRWKIFGRIISILFTLVTLAGGLTILSYILNVASGGELDYGTKTPYIMLSVLILNAVGVFTASQEVKYVLHQSAVNDDKDTRVYMRARYFFVSYQLIIVIVLVSLYASYVFPAISPVFGGGKKQKAEFIIKAEQLDTLNVLGFQVNNRRVGPLEVIFEGADFFTVSPPDGFVNDKVKAIRIRKDMIDAALYLSEKNDTLLQ